MSKRKPPGGRLLRKKRLEKKMLCFCLDFVAKRQGRTRQEIAREMFNLKGLGVMGLAKQSNMELAC